MQFTSALWLTRFLFERALGLTYFIAFLCVVNQFKPLLGENGLLPVPQFIRKIKFFDSPSIFFWWPKNWAFSLFGWIGLVLAIVAATGLSDFFGLFLSMVVWTLLWILYLSFVNVGQTFYSFGWESLLLETGFLTLFLGDAHTPVPTILIWLLRWVLFRVMFGAGLIKIRGDHCWRDLTCLFFHYQTQPIPNPLSWYFHWSPKWINKIGVLFNHFIELAVPFGFFAPQPIAMIAGLLTISFQGTLMLSGNFAFLNFITIVLAMSTLSDSLITKIAPVSIPTMTAPIAPYIYSVWLVTALILILSIKPLLNLFSTFQVMNTNYDPFHLVNSYGAFGSITRQRYEIILEGTTDIILNEKTKWFAYEFKGKPGDVHRRPPQIAPYHLRLDWLMWFAAMGPYFYQPWFVPLIRKLLQNDKPTLQLLRKNPFPLQPPRYLRAQLYLYRFTTPQEKKQTGDWWHREYIETYFPAVSLETLHVKNFAM